MATYYVDTSATYNGNGLDSSQATSNGALGASSSLLTILTNTHPYITIVAGDKVYVRTKNGTTDCEETALATITAPDLGTKDNPINFYFDDGSIWPASGQFKLKISAASEYNIDIGGLVANIYAGDKDDRRLAIISLNTSFSGTHPYFEFPAGYSSGVEISPLGGFRVLTTSYSTTGQHTIIKDMYLKVIDSWYLTSNYPFTLSAYTTSCTLINPIFDLSSMVGTPDEMFIVQPTSSRGNIFQVIGGKVIGGVEGLAFIAVATTSDRNPIVKIEGLDISSSPIRILPLTTINDYPVTSQTNSITAVGCGNPYNVEMMLGPAFVEFKNIGTYPTLNATLPDGNNTPWSYKVYPKGTRENAVAQLPQVEKLFTDTSSTKTITLELLIQDTLSVNKSNLYMVVQYIDDTSGLAECISTNDGSTTALDSSTAGWTNTTYGDFVYNKYKLSVTTPTAIKQGTVIRALLFCGIKRVNATDIFFYDPDISVT